MDDNQILKRISELVDEEHQLTQQWQQGDLSEEGHRRMRQLEVNLDQCWDLLRQRRALRSAHLNPDEAKVRDADIVERYKQ
ncbi:MAG TPA: DUF2630 family protein [Ktedonobacteraceae bacterium]|jgi:hypothetical protein|nr:DUF2630 family protein [Ktedonobacteraceae bacterium]